MSNLVVSTVRWAYFRAQFQCGGEEPAAEDVQRWIPALEVATIRWACDCEGLRLAG